MTVVAGIRQVILAGRRAGEIPPGPPAAVLARAGRAAVEAAVIALAGGTATITRSPNASSADCCSKTQMDPNNDP